MGAAQTSTGRQRVAIIGAGILGVASAIWLQRAGHEVILIDREGPAAGASQGNGGVLAACAILPVSGPGLIWKAPRMLLSPQEPLFLRWSYLPRLAPWLARFLGQCNAPAARHRARAMTQLISDSLADHQALSAGTGAERWIVPSDYMYLYRDRAAFDADRFTWQVRAENGFAWDELEGPALRAADPCFGPELGFGARMGQHGRISDPRAYVETLADHAIARGARLIQGEAEGITRDTGRVTGVRVGGETVACDQLLLCAGAWSGPLARDLGLQVPLESERGYHIELWDPSIMPRTPVMHAGGKFVITPMEGRLRVAGVVELGGLDAPPSEAPFALLEAGVRAALPGLSWRAQTRWMGHRPSVADSLPLLGPVPGLEGAFVGFGHDHVGLTGGARSGQILAQMIAGQRPNIDLGAFDPGRFGPAR